MVNKQSQSQEQDPEYSVANEEIGESLLLRCWDGAVQQVNDAIQINKDSGVKYPDWYIGFFDQAKPMDVQQKLRWLNAARHKKSMDFITLESLKAAGQISSTELKLFGDLEFPRRELTGMTRHQDRGKKEWLIRFERWVALTAAAGVITVPANNIDFTRRISFTVDMVPVDPNDSSSPNVRVVKIGPCLPGYETAEKIYLTPFTKENVLSAMQVAQRPTEPSLHGHISLTLSGDGRPYPTSAPDLDTFVNADFDELYDHITKPAPQINISGKDLASYLRHDAAAKEKQQYQ